MEKYEDFIKKTKTEYPDFFETMGEAYFKEIYDTQVQVEKDYKRVKKAFTTTQPYETSIDLQDVDTDDTKALIEKSKIFSKNLEVLLSDDCYDALYACPEIAAFMKLSTSFKPVDKINLVGVYKFGYFGTDNCQTIDCYKAPNEVAEKDCLLLHKRNGEWLKLEVKISEYYERKYNVVREKAKSTYYLR